MSKVKILMTSIGSYVGSNFLACVESRRDQVYVVGTNSVADAPNNFACDTIYLSPETSNLDQYLECVVRIFRDEQPDLVLPGRDEDIYALALLREREAHWRDRIAVGPPEIASMLLDKYATFEFAQQNDLSFASSISTDHSTKAEDAERLLQQVGFPLVAKPRLGFGSRGVFFIITEPQLADALDRPNYVIQEYLGDCADVYDHVDELAAGIPLFFQIPDDKQFIGHAHVSPSGEISEIFTQRTTMVMGRPVRVEAMIEQTLLSLIEKCAARFADVGWQGSVNLQCRPRSGDSDFAGFELGGRMSGASAARMLLGFDEVKMLVEGFCQPKKIRSVDVRKAPNVIVRSLSDFPIYDEDVRNLEQSGKWQPASARSDS